MMIIKKVVTYSLILAVCMCSLFSNDVISQAAGKKATSITLNANSKSLTVGESYQLKVKKIKPATADKSVTYKSSNTKVAKVSSKGKVTAKKAGKTTITAISKTNKKVKVACKIQVYAKVKSVSLNYKEKKIKTGETFELKAKVLPKNAKQQVTYSSSNTSVAVVSGTGKVTGKKEGKAVITVKSKADKSKKATCIVSVSAEGTKPAGTAAPTPTETEEPTPMVTNTPMPTATEEPMPTVTNTPTSTVTEEPTPTATNAPTPTVTNTPMPTATNTPMPTATEEPTPTATNTNTPTPTATNTPTPTATEEPRLTVTEEPTPTVTNTPTPTESPVPMLTPGDITIGEVTPTPMITLSPGEGGSASSGGNYAGLAGPRTDASGNVTYDCVYFGSYPQSDVTGQTKEPIKWRILDINGTDAFLVADQNLDVYRYNETWDDVTWETCTLRSWLNGYGSSENFINRAFTATEQAAIPYTRVVNEDNPEYGTEGGNDTLDKIYLLSIQEVSNARYGFLPYKSESDSYICDKARERTNTAYVAAGGSINSFSFSMSGSIVWWWLRSPGDSSNYAAIVLSYGRVGRDGHYVTTDSKAVCPALHLNLSSTDVWGNAGTVTVER